MVPNSKYSIHMLEWIEEFVFKRKKRFKTLKLDNILFMPSMCTLLGCGEKGYRTCTYVKYAR
jgi:hypothetical protein